MNLLVEAASDGIEQAVAAQREGAHRVELCAALALGGLSPSPGVLEQADALLRVPFVAMVRPRPGNFCYSRAERAAMERDSAAALEAGAAGIVLGALTARGALDVALVRSFVSLAAGAEVVFHRAFDQVRDWRRALDQLMGLGVRRVLTSGGRPTAPAGVSRIAALVERSEGRIEIVAGGGVRPRNAAAVLATGVRQLHASYAPGRIAALRRSLARPGRAGRPSGGSR